MLRLRPLLSLAVLAAILHAAAFRPAPAPAGPGYALIHPGLDQTRPAGWFDPCVPIRYRLALREAPAGGAAEIRAALGEIARASGLRFVEAGTTEQVPDRSYGTVPGPDGRYPPVVLAWADRDATDLLPAGVDGMAGPVAVRLADGTYRYVSGYAVVAVDAAARRPRGFDHPLATGQLWRHELGHLVGLAHAADPAQAMAESADQAVGLGVGDRAGLAALGSMPCRTELADAVTAAP